MTELDLEAIEARADNATRGPWQVDMFDRVAASWERSEVVDGQTWIDRPFIASTDTGMEEVPDAAQDECNAQFIAHARVDVPALTAEVRRLRALLAVTA